MTVKTEQEISIDTNFIFIKKNFAHFFHISAFKHNWSLLMSNKKKMIFQTHQFFLDIWQLYKLHQNIPLRKEVTMVFGIKEITVVYIFVCIIKPSSYYRKSTIDLKKMQYNIIKLIHSLIILRCSIPDA
jgi:hypothetical protein